MVMTSPKGRKMWKYCLFATVVFASTVQGQIECHDQQTSAGNQLVFNLTQSTTDSQGFRPLDSAVWVKPHSSSLAVNKAISFKFGKMESSGDVQPEYEMTVKMLKRHVQYIFKKIGDKKTVTEGRVPKEWLNSQNWTRFSLSDSKFGFHFGNGAQTLDIQLDGFKVDAMEAVTFTGNTDITASTNCVTFEEKETTPRVTSASPTTITTTTSTPVTTPDTPTTVYEVETNTFEGDDVYTVDTDDADMIDTNSTDEPSPDIAPVPVREYLDGQECTSLPIWVWVCVGIMIVFFVLSIILLIYVIILRRRNRALVASAFDKGGALEGRLSSPGGYGHQARDLEFFKPGNKEENVMVIAPQPALAAYTQTLRLPEGNQMVSDVRFHTAHRIPDYRRSTSCPGPRDPSPNISFPAPPSTPPPEARPETVPLFTPDGSTDNRRRTYSKTRHSNRSSSRKKGHSKRAGIDADDESSLSN